MRGGEGVKRGGNKEERGEGVRNEMRGGGGNKEEIGGREGGSEE